MKLGFIIDNFGSSQLAYNLIKKLNEFLENRQDICIIGFFENLQRQVTLPNFCTMNVTETYGFDGTVVCTNPEQVQMIKRFPGPKRIIYYVHNLPWIPYKGLEVEYFQDVFCDPSIEIQTRCEDYAALIKNNFGRDSTVNKMEIEKFL